MSGKDEEKRLAAIMAAQAAVYKIAEQRGVPSGEACVAATEAMGTVDTHQKHGQDWRANGLVENLEALENGTLGQYNPEPK